jgi:PleD family two-component response regulator
MAEISTRNTNGSSPPLIMVVDDDREGARYLARLLRLTGYDSALHHCGSDALAALRAKPPSLVILDLDMPVMDGLECLRSIRADQAFSKVPVIIYSGDFTYDRMNEAQRLGAQEYVVKGAMRWPEFLKLIERHVGK